MKTWLTDKFWPIVLGTLTVVLLGLTFDNGLDLRRFTSATGVAVFALITWRLISTWTQLTVLEHALGMLLASSPLVATLAQFYLVKQATAPLPDNPLLWLVLAHRLACIVLVVFWNVWLGRRVSPFKRTVS